MAANLSKKFELLCCCLMTMQALRLVISTAGFCVVRFHIDCSLFNIFISRLVNAVMMSQLFGNWLGDLFVFALGGKQKMWAAAGANWIQFICFCTALFSICHTECGHLTGFYWSMVIAYFWWKVGEAPATSIGGDELDWYFAGFTLSGVWGSSLKGLVMRCVADGAKTASFHSVPLGDVNVKIVGARSVKTTVDYRASKYLFIIVIVLTFLMNVAWTTAAGGVQEVEVKEGSGIKVTGVTRNGLKGVVGIAFGGVLAVPGAMLGAVAGWVFALCFKCCLPTAKYASLTKWCQLIFGIVGAIGGVILSAVLLSVVDKGTEDEWIAVYKVNKQAVEKVKDTAKDTQPYTVKDDSATDLEYWPFVGLGAGLVTGALVGLCIGAMVGAAKGQVKRKLLSGLAAGAFFGSFFGLLSGEITAGALVRTGKGWRMVLDGKQDASGNWTQGEAAVNAEGEWMQMELVWGTGMLIVVLGCGTVYSIYPGMAPCSITQFKYFNIIDILILTLSSIGPLVMMGIDLAGEKWKLSGVITGKVEGQTVTLDAGKNQILLGAAIGAAVLMTAATNVCEILVLNIMQHPHSKLAKDVTNSGWRACTLTIMMVSFQLTSTGVGFGCVAAGSAFNDGIMNVNSTLVLWTMECCAVLGEGYLTELKKYEPGKWPTQGMGKCATYRWWNNKAFGNAWAIWCCIGTTDLRRDIMLCRQ